MSIKNKDEKLKLVHDVATEDKPDLDTQVRFNTVSDLLPHVAAGNPVWIMLDSRSVEGMALSHVNMLLSNKMLRVPSAIDKRCFDNYQQAMIAKQVNKG